MPLRSVRDALTSSQKSPKRRRIQIAACPICRTRMSTIILDTHIDRCKPPPPIPSQSSSPPQSQLSNVDPPPPSSLGPFYLTLTPDTLYTRSCTCTSRPFIAEIHLRNSPVLHLHICNVAAFHIPPLPPGCPGVRLSPSILKSALQKAIRRRHVHPAMRIAAVLMRRAPADLLRRLLVIMIEDVVLHPDAGYIALLMAAVGRSYSMSLRDVRCVIKFAGDLAMAESRDYGVFGGKKEEGDCEEEHGERDWWKLIVAMKVRAAYGGMGGDVDMLNGAVSVWRKRFEKEEAGWWEVVREVYKGVEVSDEVIDGMFKEEETVLRRGDIPLAAFDFHCCEVGMEVARELRANEMVRERFGNELDGIKAGVERLMWKYRSSINVKKVWRELDDAKSGGKKAEEAKGGEEEVLWMVEIEGAVNEWCRNYRKRYGI